MKKKAFQILLCCNLLILFPTVCTVVWYSIINFKYDWPAIPPNWFFINIIYGLLFSIAAMIIISISTLIIIEKECTKGNMILFIWLIFCPFWFLIITDIVSYEVFLLMPVIVMVIICINTLIIIKKENKKENIIKQNLFIWLALWLLNAFAILSSFGIAMIVARQ
ncbi:MAG: hypothetical protein HDR01_11275 [Lachnospiraceae bacterium]|nr:hypothetical protein [Lachnospiraceae bacterium]